MANWASGLAGWATGLAGWPRGGNGWMDGWTNEQKIYPFYSSSPIGAAALLSPLKPMDWLAGWASGLAGWASGLAGWASGLTGWPREGDVWMHV